MTTLVWTLKSDDAQLLGSLRTEPNLEVCESAQGVWVRCKTPSEELQLRFMHLPAVQSVVTDDGQLIERGTRVPWSYMLEGPWLPIAHWLSVNVPIAAFGGTAPLPLPLQLTPDESYRTAALLRTHRDAWISYALSSPQMRLDRLAFAAADDDTVLIRGEPLPPIAGTRFVVQGNVAVEAGWTWSPSVSVEVVEKVLNVTERQLAILSPNSEWIVVAADDFVQATRSAVRATWEDCPDAV